MFCVFFSDVFYAKVVDNECERYWSCCVFPQAGHQFALEISVFVEALFKQFVRKESCLGQSMHSLCDLDTNHALFVGYFLQFVFIDDFLGHVVDFHSDIFWFWSGKMMNYRQLRKHPKYNKAWTTSSNLDDWQAEWVGASKARKKYDSYTKMTYHKNGGKTSLTVASNAMYDQRRQKNPTVLDSQPVEIELTTLAKWQRRQRTCQWRKYCSTASYQHEEHDS